MIFASGFTASAYTSTSVNSFGTSTVYDVLSLFNPEKSYSVCLIPKFFNLASVSFSGLSSSAVNLVTLIIYVFCVTPSSAVTVTFNLFSPSFNFTVPVPVTVAFESLGVA